MGVGGAGPQGLSIKTIQMAHDTSSGRVTRVSEAGIVFQFGSGVGDHSAIRLRGLKLGFRIRRAHTSADVAFTTGAATTAPAQTGPPPAQYMSLTEDTQVTQELRTVFGTDRCRLLWFSWPTERWIGFSISGNSIPPAVTPASSDRLFFRIVLGHFSTIHQRECDVLPVVATMGDIPFQQHYALGISVYTRGSTAGAPVFDTQVLGRG
jgi:hypothetical protein